MSGLSKTFVLGLVMAMLACLMRLFQLIFLHATMLTFYVSGCTDNRERLLRAAFYRAGLHFSLHGWQEHRHLKVEQLTRVPAEGYSAKTYCMWRMGQRITKEGFLR